MRYLQTAWLHDPARAEAAIARVGNDWFAYVEDLFDQIGAPARPLDRSLLTDAAALARISVLALPAIAASDLSAEALAALDRWVCDGGVLLGFAAAGADRLFGVLDEGRIDQPAEPWSITATLRFTDSALARPVLHADRPEPTLLAVSPVRLLRALDATWLAELADREGRPLGRPAITLRRYGLGWAALFAFDPAQTVWMLHQGRPVDRDYTGDGYLRSNDGIIIGDHDPEVPYADLLCHLLRNVVALSGQPFFHALPALDGAVPDALFYWGGDDEGCPPEADLFAARFMADCGLPYHVNIMPTAGRFQLAPEHHRELRALGTEPSLHPNFIDGYQHPLRFTATEVREQVQWYVQAFGETPVCTVFHWALWHGWTEPAEMLRAAGVQADNSRFGRIGLNPVNHLSYSFGTSYPFFYRLDGRSGNARLDFVAEPLTAYEPGYERDGRTAFDPLHRALSDAAWWHAPMNLFFHSVCLFGYPEARAAVAEVQRWLTEHGLSAVHMGNDRLNHWWRSRARARFEEARRDVGWLSFIAECDWPEGYVVMAPWLADEADVRVDGQAATADLGAEHGVSWVRVVLPPGRHQVQIVEP